MLFDIFGCYSISFFKKWRASASCAPNTNTITATCLHHCIFPLHIRDVLWMNEWIMTKYDTHVASKSINFSLFWKTVYLPASIARRWSESLNLVTCWCTETNFISRSFSTYYAFSILFYLKTENLYEVLKERYGEKGIDVVYESVGGQTFQTCLNRLAVKGRLIVIGFISAYHSAAGIDRTHKDATMVNI